MVQARKYHTRVPEQTDLHLFEHIEALNPTHVAAGFQKVNARTRWLMVLLVASLVLLVSVYGLTRIGINYLESTQGPFLYEALQAPFSLDNRTVVLLNGNNESGLPVQLGEFTLQPSETSSVDAQSVKNPPAACLISSADAESNCQSTLAALDIFTGSYQSQSNFETVDTIAARFGTHEEASQRAMQVFQKVSSVSQIGNYTFGTGSVDYFFSHSQGILSLTWTNDVWLYSVSGKSLANVEAFVETLPSGT